MLLVKDPIRWFDCNLLVIWMSREKATFEKKLIKYPSKIEFPARSLLLYWEGLQS